MKGNRMKRFSSGVVLWILLTAICFCQTWTQSNGVWSNAGIRVSIPVALKPQPDSAGVLGAHGNGVSVTVRLLQASEDFKSFANASSKELKPFKNIRWSEPQYGRDGEVDMALRVGHYRAKDGELEFTLSTLQKGKRKVGVMTVQKVGDKVGSDIISGIINSIGFF